MKNIVEPSIHFTRFSKKQMQVFTWWCQESPYGTYNGIICDGSIRAGKTVAMALAFIFWAMSSYDHQNFAVCGKTVGSFRRNVWNWVRGVLQAHHYKIIEIRTTNTIVIDNGKHTNYFYIFGGRDESSQDLIQGMTLAGLYCDEVALMPESFVNQATGRCSVPGAKMWFNCNPESPIHWFLKKWIEKADEKRLLHLHFTMDDNLSLTDAVRERYKSTYSGVFYQRFILGLWVMAQGAIYKDCWSDDLYFGEDELKHIYRNITYYRRYIGIDYGTVNPMVFLDAYDDGDTIWITREYYWDSRAEGSHEKDNSQYGDDLMQFISDVDYPPTAVIVDPSAASFKIEMRNRGLRAKATVDTINADNDVLEGIRNVSRMLTRKKIRIYKPACPMLIKEMTSYCWDEKALQKTGKEKPIKVADHTADALRYLISTVVKPRRLANA